MSTLSFTLTLVLLGTIGAVQTDNPMFWLLIGPTPFAVVFTGLVFFRQWFSPRHEKSAVLRPEHRAVNFRAGKRKGVGQSHREPVCS
jgi:hypothetical protein